MFSDSDAEKRWDRRARTPEPPCSGPRLAVELQILWTVQQMAQQQQLMAAAIFQILHMFHATPPPRTDANSATQVAALVAATTIEEQRARSDQPQAQLKKKHRPGARMRRRRRGIADSADKADMELEENECSITQHNVHFVTETEVTVDSASAPGSNSLRLFREDSPADQQPSHVDSILEPWKVIVGQNRLSRTVQAMLNSPSHLAAANDSAKACSTTLNVDFSDVNAKGSYGCTVLHWAAASNNVAVCKAILAHEGFTEVDAKDTTRGWTALHWAAARGHLDACQAILDSARFTEINAHAKLGDWTALHLAASAGYSGVCRAILCHGDFMDIDKQNIDGDTAMQLAVKHGHGEVIEVIDGYNQLVALLL
eukprot:gnl/TRDRNA2_/TRDRNA2_176606_c0_seq8.p1 gnl/TRDRNA2_/TRDRNA2_176606_c0~~gnl/TRDRNA2_/TRDRNA2_176606_c0_seq8.p1  ORF type:complete len:370 (+),score=70.35 gnl/TRDRNA2_/TRDRNA2_176606_c0_seq8:64-1173(+)